MRRTLNIAHFGFVGEDANNSREYCLLKRTVIFVRHCVPKLSSTQFMLIYKVFIKSAAKHL